MKTSSSSAPEVYEAPAKVSSRNRAISIGLPKCIGQSERRFPLTPEAAGILIERGFVVRLEEGAGNSIHYRDTAYSRVGVNVTTRDEALKADIVIHLAPLPETDIFKMKRGAMLLTLLSICHQTKSAVKALLERRIISIALDLIEDQKNNRPFADILEEIDGRSSVAIAASLLADAIHGKGILLGGVSGIVPCEVMIIGSGIAAAAAARSASGAGALVRIFDNDIYRLRSTTRELGPWAVGSALHPKVMHNALRSADIVIFTEITDPVVFGIDVISEMKKGVVIFDLTHDCGKAFPSLRCVDLADASPEISEVRCCYVNAGSAVPRTAAMAISNTLLTFMRDIMACEGVMNAVKLLPGIQKAACTFLGKAVNPQIAAVVGVRAVDINIYLTLS